MSTKRHTANKALSDISNPEKRVLSSVANEREVVTPNAALIRFQEKNERYIWAHPDEIIFVKSADHYVNALIKYGKQNRWMSRHCTIKQLFTILLPYNFIRLNKFYLLNRNHFSSFNKHEKVLYLDDKFSIPVPHRISRYILDLIKE